MQKTNGESYREIFSYWLPEFITSMIIVAVPLLIDAYLIASLKSLTTYGALGIASGFLHVIGKAAEAIPVASVAMIGRHNGAKEYEKCGERLGDSFWTAFILGAFQFLIILFFAAEFFRSLQTPEDMIIAGTPYLKLKALGMLLVFTFQAFVGFLRGVKNTRAPMFVNIFGIAIFVFFDYALIKGAWGFPEMGLLGSALATLIQHIAMITAVGWYLSTNADYKKYFKVAFYSVFNLKRIGHLLNLSWPIMIDKGSLALAYVWLAKMINPMGVAAICTFDVIKNLERFSFLPAIAFAQVVTFLVSNRLGAKDPDGALADIKKVLIFTSGIILVILTVLCIYSRYFISLFDPLNKFTDFATPLVPILSVMVVFDFIQLILAAALRGAGDVKSVMWGRALSCAFVFVPLAYLGSHVPIENTSIRFLLTYGALYVNTAVMGIFFLWRIRSRAWQRIKI